MQPKVVTAGERARLETQIKNPVGDSAIGTASQLYVCVVKLFCSANPGNGLFYRF